VAPGPGARGVDGAQPIRLGLSGVPAAGSPLPRLSPPVAGTWNRDGASLVFTPAAGFPERTRVSVAYPAGHPRDGMAAWTASFRTGTYSTLRLQQLLAQLGYLPLSWTPGAGGTVMPGNAQAQLSAAYEPPAGRFGWISGYPAALSGFWRAGSANLIDTGAIMALDPRGPYLSSVPRVYTFRVRRGKISSVCSLAHHAFGVWITHLASPHVRPATGWPAFGPPGGD
jgi:hypothetical protein